jgi:hypothetical protein
VVKVVEVAVDLAVEVLVVEAPHLHGNNKLY